MAAILLTCLQHIAEPVFENCSNRLILANHSLKQLNIIDDNNEKYTGKLSSVIKLLNQCLTPMGKRKFVSNFLNPINDSELLQREYDITDVTIKFFNNNENIFFKINVS